jgi:hypothetical protein
MIVIIGLVVLVAAVIAGVAGVLANSGSSHALTHGFAVFGYHVTGSTGTLFLYGMVVGAIGVFGLVLLLAGARRTSRRGRAARRGLRQSQRETAAASQARDDLIGEREAARASAAATPETMPPPSGDQPDTGGSRWGWDRLQRFGHRPGPSGAASEPGPAASPPGPDVAADSPRPAGSAANGSRP